MNDTLAKIIPLSNRIGITRISDITYLDRLYLPNYSVVLPGTEDSIWVYGGKGPTKSHAKASAIMEAIERYSALSSTYHGSYIRGSYSELSKSYDKVLHPQEVVEPVNKEYDETRSNADYLAGFDLITNQNVLVPAKLALTTYSSRSSAIDIFPYSHTNGLASGNVLEEAICHALCEVIERDAVSIADLCASFIPYTILEKIGNSLKGMKEVERSLSEISHAFVDDFDIFPDVDISEIIEDCEPLKILVRRFSNAGIPLLVKDITQKVVGIPTFVASSIEWISSDYGYFAKGYGTHPDAKIALMRAITEVSQTRVVNIQGARDDLKKIKYREHDEIYKRKWQFISSANHHKNKNRINTISFSKIKTYANEDILDDIKLILKGLRRDNLKRAIIIDLTNPNVGIPVVRAIVPGLETFEVAKLIVNSEALMGDRAKNYFKRLQNSG